MKCDFRNDAVGCLSATFHPFGFCIPTTALPSQNSDQRMVAAFRCPQLEPEESMMKQRCLILGLMTTIGLRASAFLIGAGLLAILVTMAGPASAQSQGKTVSIDDSRGYVFCENDGIELIRRAVTYASCVVYFGIYVR
jgi:hypothetical protein